MILQTKTMEMVTELQLRENHLKRMREKMMMEYLQTLQTLQNLPDSLKTLQTNLKIYLNQKFKVMIYQALVK